MAPEYGATMGFFPIDAECVNYLRATGRSEELCLAYENYYRAQDLFGIPKKGDIAYSQELELDLGTVVPSVAVRSARRTGSNCATEAEIYFLIFKAGHGK